MVLYTPRTRFERAFGVTLPMKDLLETESWIAEARPMHLDMMQRRKNINGRSHNVSLADVVLDEGAIEAYLSSFVVR